MTHAAPALGGATQNAGASPALELRGAVKSYGLWRPRPALRGVTLRVERGECYGLAGQNGAGKTTLIRLLLGLAAPDAGEVRLLGRQPLDPEARRRVGFVPEAAELPPAASPRALLRRWARLRGLDPGPAQEQGLSALETLGMSALLDRPAGRLSKGERQRTLLALALLGEPELLVLDEPTDGLDPLGRALMRQVIRDECGRGRTVFLNSHLLAETERVCTRVGILHRGELVREERLGGRAPCGPAESAILLGAPVPAAAQAAAGAHPFPAGTSWVHELAAASCAEVLLVRHADAAGLNRAIDALRAAAVPILEVRRVRADLESALAEVVEDGGPEALAAPAPDGAPPSAGRTTALEPGERAAPSARLAASASPPLPEPPPQALRPLRAISAGLRVAVEIGADLASRRVGWVALVLALVICGGFLAGVRSQLVQGLAATARMFGRSGGLLEAQTVANQVGSGAAGVMFWSTLFCGLALAALFAPPLLEPRRTVLLLAQPISRVDFAAGLYLAVCGMAGVAAAFFAALLFGGLRLLGLPVSPRFLLLVLPWLCAFSALYAMVLLATWLSRSGILAAAAGLCVFIGTVVLGESRVVRDGTAPWAFLYGLLPKLVELGRQAGRAGQGLELGPAPFVTTLIPCAALLLLLAVAARRSER